MSHGNLRSTVRGEVPEKGNQSLVRFPNWRMPPRASFPQQFCGHLEIVQRVAMVELGFAIQQLVDNPKIRLDMGEKGQQRAIETFSIASYIQNFENLFLKLK